MGPRPQPTEDPFGLTPRERQVLALLAEGATNRQIGAALFMAEKTASVHVSRILAKLGVQGPHPGGGGRAPPAPRLRAPAERGVGSRGDAHAGRMGAPRANADGLAVPARAVGRDDRPGAGGLRRGRQRDRRVRAGDDDRQPGRGRRRRLARPAADGVEIVELPLDDSWLRDCGPIYAYGDDGERVAVHFRFNAWGEKFPPWDRDAAVGG